MKADALLRRLGLAGATLRHMSVPIELPFETLSWQGGLEGHVRMIEQTLLPLEEKQIEVRSVPEMVDAIWRLAVRGAPAIGVAAGFGMVLGIREAAEGDDVLEAARQTKRVLDASRPTAVNLMWATERVLRHLENIRGDGVDLKAACLSEALAIYEGDQGDLPCHGRARRRADLRR